MNKRLISRPISWAVVASDAPIFDRAGYTVSIEDEAAGEFVRITDHSDSTTEGIAIEPADWPVLKDAITHAMSQCQRQYGDITKETKT